jgi:hypothetical protein
LPHCHITLGTMPHAGSVDDSSRGDIRLTLKAVGATAIVVGLAIVAEPIPGPEELGNFIAFDLLVGSAGRIATDRRALARSGYFCGQGGCEPDCGGEEAGGVEEVWF